MIKYTTNPVDILSMKLYVPNTNPPLLAFDPIISQIKLITEFITIAWAIPITAVAKKSNYVWKDEWFPPSRINDAKMERTNLC